MHQMQVQNALNAGTECTKCQVQVQSVLRLSSKREYQNQALGVAKCTRWVHHSGHVGVASPTRRHNFGHSTVGL